MRTSVCNLLIAAAVVLSLGACGAKTLTVDLAYAPVVIENQSCAGRVSLVRFVDARKDVAVASEDDTSYFPSTDVGMWVTTAIQEQLKLAGCSVEFHDREYSFDTPATISGVVENAFAKKTGMTTWTTNFRIRMVVRKAGGGQDFVKYYGGQFEKSVLFPSSENKSKLLKEGLQDMLRQAVPDMLEQINRY